MGGGKTEGAKLGSWLDEPPVRHIQVGQLDFSEVAKAQGFLVH